MNPPPVPPSEPAPFGDPTRVRAENAATVRKGVLFGCGGCLIIVLCFAAFVTGIMAIVFGSLLNSDVCKEAFARAQASRQVQAALGKPIEKGWFVSGSVRSGMGEGHADVWIPISGPEDSARIHAVAVKEADGTWTFKVLSVVTEKSGRTVDLMPGPSA